MIIFKPDGPIYKRQADVLPQLNIKTGLPFRKNVKQLNTWFQGRGRSQRNICETLGKDLRRNLWQVTPATAVGQSGTDLQVWRGTPLHINRYHQRVSRFYSWQKTLGLFLSTSLQYIKGLDFEQAAQTLFHCASDMIFRILLLVAVASAAKTVATKEGPFDWINWWKWVG